MAESPPVERIDPGYVDVYLLRDDDGLIVVDTGLDRRARRILAAVADGRGSVAAIVITHHHSDHASGLAALREATGAPALAHPLDEPRISGREARPRPGTLAGRAVDLVAGSFAAAGRIDGLIEDGDQIGGWRVVHLPGHTAGQIGLLRAGNLVCGDAVMAAAGLRAPLRAFTEALAAMRRSISLDSRADP